VANFGTIGKHQFLSVHQEVVQVWLNIRVISEEASYSPDSPNKVPTLPETLKLEDRKKGVEV